MNKRVWMVWGLAVLMTGCIKTSPLMFVSKTTLGVEISAPGAGQGASEPNLTIGFKTFDAAYVPVVVGIAPKESRLITASNEVTGPAGDQSTPETPQSTATESEVKTASGTPKAPPPSPPQVALSMSDTRPLSARTQQRNDFAARRSDAAAQGIETLAQTMNEMRQSLAATRAEYEKAPLEEKNSSAERLREQIGDLKELSLVLERLIDTRTDALSVFSVIDADVWGRSGDAKMGLGKIFATGLAAQKVADHYRTPYSACSGELISTAAALDIADTKKKEAFFAALATLCPKRGER